MSKPVPLTDEQANTLLMFIDVAVKTLGLSHAGVAYELAVLIQSAMKAEASDEVLPATDS